MQHRSISEISQTFSVSTRTLRYYEQLGLLHSHRLPDYAYRIYDEQAVLRLRQILTLRALRVPLKKIAAVLQSSDPAVLFSTLQETLSDLTAEAQQYSAVCKALQQLTVRLQKNDAEEPVSHALLVDESFLSVAQLLPHQIKKEIGESAMEKPEMLNALAKLKDVRLLRIAPCTVAACHYIGESPETQVMEQLRRFVLEQDLYRCKPDARVFGFNHPNPSSGRLYGYEMWVTIPDGLELPAPFQKKQFAGGLYAAHMIEMGNFQEWQWLTDWINTTDEYEPVYNPEGEVVMGGCLEEHLNFVYDASHPGCFQPEKMQLDLLTPVRKK